MKNLQNTPNKHIELSYSGGLYIVQEGLITDVHKSAISVSAYPTNIYDMKLGPTEKLFFRSTMFETFQIEWLDQDSRVEPTWEDMSWVTYHEWRI